MNLLQARDLGYVVDGQQVLNGVDLDLAPGERLAVMGPSGSGKTTLLALLAGLAAPSTGEVRLDAHADQLVEELSGGQQQRTAVARALALQPRLLIADEPTAELDPASRALVLARLLEVADRGGALVLATHDAEVASRCDRILDLRPTLAER